MATLGLAVGVGAGAMVPAYAGADNSFSAHVSNGLISQDSEEVDISGTKSSTSALVDIETNLSNSAQPSCGGTDAGSANWTCDIGFDGASPNQYNVIFTEQNADLTVVHEEISFNVYPVDSNPYNSLTAPDMRYLFTPGAVNVKSSSTATDVDPYSANYIWTGDSETTIGNCPSTSNGRYNTLPFGRTAASTATCNYRLPASIDSLGENSPTAYVIRGVQGGYGEGPYIDNENETDAIIFVPYDSINQDTDATLAYTTNTTTRTVTVTGSVNQTAWSGGGQNRDQPAASVEILDSNDAVLCSTNRYTQIGTSNYASFSCTTPTLGYGSHTLRAVVVDDGYLGNEDISNASYENDLFNLMYVTGAMSASTTVGTINFPAPVTNVPGTGAALVAPIWSFTISGDLNNLQPGDTITINGQGLPSGTNLDTVLHSIPVDLGSVVAQSDGTFTQTVVIPPDTVPGAHTIQVTASGTGLVTTTQEQAITLHPNESTSGNGGTKTKPHTGVHQAGEGNGNGTTALQPNILTKALTPIADVAVHPNKIASAIEIGLVLLLLAVLPAHLLNATIAEQSDRFERRFRKVHEPRWLARFIAAIRSAPVFGGLIVAVITAILFGFADPKFGLTLASLRLVLAAGIALFLVGYVANWLTSAIARRQWHITVMVSIRPYGLILTVVGVIVSRLLDFSPGFLIGLILGLTIQGKSAAGFAWRTVMTRTLIVLAMSVAAWVGYSTLTLGGNEGGTFGTELLVETFVAITTEGVVALLVELLPLRFLEGEKLYEHSRWVWAGLYFLTVVVFVLAVIPWEGNWDALGNSLWVWILVLAVFALICVGVYIYFRRFAKPLEEEAGNEEVALGEHVGRD